MNELLMTLGWERIEALKEMFTKTDISKGDKLLISCGSMTLQAQNGEAVIKAVRHLNPPEETWFFPAPTDPLFKSY